MWPPHHRGIYPEEEGYYSNLCGDTAYSRGVPTGRITEKINAKTMVVGAANDMEQ
jgi:hypothetical protein